MTLTLVGREDNLVQETEDFYRRCRHEHLIVYPCEMVDLFTVPLRCLFNQIPNMHITYAQHTKQYDVQQ